ncbi:alpha-methylacyl-CoA racemase isoform X2 [Parasteatoda tepidariorum]|uniref:alpha-methylacyl-CoA racemase isoform X2 n=1 Tax=Parasteatoda tepidariorum TaxID=114398 RepID=UPI001C729907|nr:alpha-methylacyl-CoA racemase isoform X2 [Parasteatoda tepidariorum]
MALRGLKVIELAGLAPAPFCGMILSDFGATVTRIDKPDTYTDKDSLSRGKRSLSLDLKKTAAAHIITKLCSTADVLIDPYRPGVLEKYNLDPSVLCKVNPALIFARMTGFGQNGPFAKMAGHDINYIAISGVLSMIGGKDKPQAPINLLGDFAGGGLICALGICLALLERHKSGKGQVIDANMVAGSAYVSSFLWTTKYANIPIWLGPRGTNVLDGGTHFYNTYRTKDGKFMSVGAIETKFYSLLCKGLGVDPEKCPQFDNWDENIEMFSKIFLTKTQEEWCKIFDLTDACVAPVLPMEEAHHHPHNSCKGTFICSDEKVVPSPAPTLSRTPAAVKLTEPLNGQHSIEILREEGFSSEEIKKYIDDKVVHALNVKSSL